MNEKVVQSRANQEPNGFQSALRWWRSFAHRRSLIVASPTRLVGAERTMFGDSEEDNFGPKDYRLISADMLFDGELYLTKNEKKVLGEIADTLLEMHGVDIKDCRAPENARVPPHEEERGRWDIMLTPDHKVGTVVRVGDGNKKHYLMYLWDGAWYRVTGQPCFDIPLFGLPGLRVDTHKPVMIHEGPKAYEGALLKSDGRFTTGRLANWLSLYTHIAWHGAATGIETTDWSPLRGRRVLVWSDLDESGVIVAQRVAKQVSRMGGIVEYVAWGRNDIEAAPAWDWGDEVEGAFLENLTRAQVRERLRRVESPVDFMGNVHEDWMKRSYYDQNKGEVYMESRNYEPVTLPALNLEYGKGTGAAIATSEVNPYMGRAFIPGRSFGKLPDGRINLCKPCIREPIQAAPLARVVYKEITRRWLGKMIPNVDDRKHLLRKAALAIVKPEKRSNHMIVLQGMSGIGKSVSMDLMCAVAGKDRAGAVYPDSIFKNFNDAIKDKTLICIHEIHSDDITRKQNASRLKELIGNEHITVRQKFRDDEVRDNVIHWFGATNERVPFALEHGNDRFYFVRCVEPKTPRDQAKARKFFYEWKPVFDDPVFQDTVYAAAKWLLLQMPEEHLKRVMGRARRQRIWKVIEMASMRPWEQELYGLLQELVADWEEEWKEKVDRRPFFAFFGQEIARLIKKNNPRVGPRDIEFKMREFGFRSLQDKNGGAVKRRVGQNRREPIWVRESDLNDVIARGNFGGLAVRSLYNDSN